MSPCNPSKAHHEDTRGPVLRIEWAGRPGLPWTTSKTPETVTVNGVRIAWEMLVALTQPTGEWLRMTRVGDEVTVHQLPPKAHLVRDLRELADALEGE